MERVRRLVSVPRTADGGLLLPIPVNVVNAPIGEVSVPRTADGGLLLSWPGWGSSWAPLVSVPRTADGGLLHVAVIATSEAGPLVSVPRTADGGLLPHSWPVRLTGSSPQSDKAPL